MTNRTLDGFLVFKPIKTFFKPKKSCYKQDENEKNKNAGEKDGNSDDSCKESGVEEDNTPPTRPFFKSKS